MLLSTYVEGGRTGRSPHTGHMLGTLSWILRTSSSVNSMTASTNVMNVNWATRNEKARYTSRPLCCSSPRYLVGAPQHFVLRQRQPDRHHSRAMQTPGVRPPLTPLGTLPEFRGGTTSAECLVNTFVHPSVPVTWPVTQMCLCDRGHPSERLPPHTFIQAREKCRYSHDCAQVTEKASAGWPLPRRPRMRLLAH